MMINDTKSIMNDYDEVEKSFSLTSMGSILFFVISGACLLVIVYLIWISCKNAEFLPKKCCKNVHMYVKKAADKLHKKTTILKIPLDSSGSSHHKSPAFQMNRADAVVIIQPA